MTPSPDDEIDAVIEAIETHFAPRLSDQRVKLDEVFKRVSNGGRG